MTAELAELFAQASRSSDGAIVLDSLIVMRVAGQPSIRSWGGCRPTWFFESRIRDLVLRDGERTVVLESTDSANGAVTIAVTASALDEPAGQRAAGSAAPIRVGDGVPPPRKVHDVPPVYPSAARTLRVQGLVILEATIGPTGEVVDVEVLRSVLPELDAAAVAAVEQWRYEPTLVDGEAVPVVMTVTDHLRPARGTKLPIVSPAARGRAGATGGEPRLRGDPGVRPLGAHPRRTGAAWAYTVYQVVLAAVVVLLAVNIRRHSPYHERTNPQAE